MWLTVERGMTPRCCYVVADRRRDRAVRVVRVGLGNRVVALHCRCTVVILKVGVIDVMVAVIFTLYMRSCCRCSRSRRYRWSRCSRTRRHGTRTSHRRVVGKAFQIIVHEIDIGIIHIIMLRMIRLLLVMILRLLLRLRLMQL